ncbi:MAG: tetratricopeptide repeat protein, partial [Bacteroidales bacterium]
MDRRLRNIKPIIKAIQNERDPEPALEDTLISMPKEGIKRIILELMKVALNDDRYIPVFDLLHARFPDKVSILKGKALVCDPDYPTETIEALSKAIALLHQKYDDHPDIVEFYFWAGHVYEKQDKLHQAIAAYSLAISHYNFCQVDINRYLDSLYKRSMLYLKTNQKEKG